MLLFADNMNLRNLKIRKKKPSRTNEFNKVAGCIRLIYKTQ